jgi:hypothetical protein
MAKLEDKAHEQFVKALADVRCSPAVLARKMLSENLYVNESMLQYLINYVITMATATHVPISLTDVHADCVNLYHSLTELGLTGTVGRMPILTNEYLAV